MKILVSLGIIFKVTLLVASAKNKSVNDEDITKFANAEHALRVMLLKNYEPDMPPLKHESDNITLKFGLTLISVADLDEQRGVFTVDCMMKMMWTDFRLAWNSTKEGVTKPMHVSPRKLWLPDVRLFNLGDTNYQTMSLEHPTLVDPNGMVLWIPQCRHTAHCEMDITRFPYDQHTCHLIFGSWTHDAKSLDMKAFAGDNYSADTSWTKHSAEWELTSHNGTKHLKYYACCPNTPYADVTYSFTFKRKSSFFVHVFIAPAVVLALLIPFMFTMVPDSAEKIKLGSSIMICLVLMILMVENVFPAAMVGLPLLVQYFASSFVLVAAAIIFNIWTNKMMRCRTRDHPPRAFSWLIIDIFGRFLCLNKDAFLQNDDRGFRQTIETELDEGMAEAPATQPIGRLRPAQVEWMMIGVVIDRFFFLLFLILVIIVTIVMVNY